MSSLQISLLTSAIITVSFTIFWLIAYRETLFEIMMFRPTDSWIDRVMGIVIWIYVLWPLSLIYILS